MCCLAIAFQVDVRTAEQQRSDNVLADHAVADAQPAPDGRRIEPMDLIHDEGLPALWRHALNQGSKVAQCLFTGELPFRRAVFRQLREELATSKLVEGLMPPAPIDGDIGGGLEKKGPQIADRTRLIQAQKADVSFLRHLKRLIVRAHAPSQETDQRLIVLAE